MNKRRYSLTKPLKRNPKVNSGWYEYIDSEMGRVWCGRKNRNKPTRQKMIYIRKIWFSLRRPKRRFDYNSTSENRANAVFRNSKYARYMEREWGVTKFIHGIVRNFTFKEWLRKH